jgi:hypothetical protein
MRQDDSMLAFLIVAVVAGAFLWSLWHAIRHPGAYASVFGDQRRWRRARAWILAITLAAMLGAWLGGAGTATLGMIGAVGFIPSAICSDFLRQARYNEWFRKFFGD